jgi:hypothetical protein
MIPFAQLQKFDDFQGIAEGTIACQEPDGDREILDYFGSKPYFQAWSDSQFANSQGKSWGNVRLQHNPQKVVGLLISPLQFDDTNIKIKVSAQILDPVAKDMLMRGALTGFSIGGDYISKRPLPNGLVSYIAKPAELSVCDRPCSPSATYDLVCADGHTELRKFMKILEGDQLLQKATALMKSGWGEHEVQLYLSVSPGMLYKARMQDAGVRELAKSVESRRRQRFETNPF